MDTSDYLNNLRERLEREGNALEDMVKTLERQRASGAFGGISTVAHASVVAQYRNTADQILQLAAGDEAANAAIVNATELSKRIAKAAVP
jgi:hypothetical protein